MPKRSRENVIANRRWNIHKKIEKKRALLHWRQNEIHSQLNRGIKLFNFTCLQTANEAQADLNKDFLALDKEIHDYCYSQR